MINIKITDDGKVVSDYNAKAVCGAIIKPELDGEEADAIAFLNGRGRRISLLEQTLMTLGSFTSNVVGDDVDESVKEFVITLLMSRFKSGANDEGLELKRSIDESRVVE